MPLVTQGKTKYMEEERHQRMMKNEKISVGSNRYEKVKMLKYFDSLLTQFKIKIKSLACSSQGSHTG